MPAVLRVGLGDWLCTRSKKRRNVAVSLESELQAGVEMATVDNAMTTADVAGSYAEPAHMVSFAPTASTLSLREQVYWARSNVCR